MYWTWVFASPSACVKRCHRPSSRTASPCHPAAHSRPPLTTVHQDFEEVGRRAVHALVARLEGRDADGASVAITPELVVRQSTAPV